MVPAWIFLFGQLGSFAKVRLFVLGSWVSQGYGDFDSPGPDQETECCQEKKERVEEEILGGALQSGCLLLIA